MLLITESFSIFYGICIASFGIIRVYEWTPGELSVHARERERATMVESRRM